MRRATDTALGFSAPVGYSGRLLTHPPPFPFPPPGPHYLQVSNWGDNGEAGWRGEIWHTSQAVASKAPPLARDASLYSPRAALGWEGGGGPRGRSRGGSRAAPFAAPSAGPEKRSFGPGPWPHLGRARRGRRRGSPQGCSLQKRSVSPLAPGQSPRLRVPREKT